MDATAASIAARMREIALYLELEGDRYRARAYQRGARAVEASHDLGRLIREKRLTELPRIGASLARLIEDLSRQDSVPLLDSLRERWPAEAVAQRQREGTAGPLLLGNARDLGESLVGHASRCPAAIQAVAAGPARRFEEVVDRLAIVVASHRAGDVLDHMRRHPLVLDVAHRDGAPALAQLADGTPCEIHVAPPEAFGLVLVAATGSPGHVAALEALAGQRGLRLREIPARDEEALYRALGLPSLPPEVRDGSDEVAAALAGDDFTDLIQLADLRGAIHCHTTYSDGKHSIEEMARAARAAGLDYITITDHSQTAHYAGGLTVARLREQWAEIAEVERRLDVRILRGTESDIRADGSLDYPDEILASLDIAIASIHQRYRHDQETMTARLVTAMRQPCFKIWGHPLGRLLESRDPIACRFDEVLDALCESPAAIELNGDPRRLDLAPDLARRALARGARFVLSCDAHSTAQLASLELAVAMARRARIRRHQVLNALPADEFARAVRPFPR
jgi:DNA polymerase (family 10)